MFKLKKILILLSVLLTFQVSKAFELCPLEGDFVPWPWSEQFYSQVLGHDWTVVDETGETQGYFTLSRSSFFWGWGTNVYTMIQSDLTGESMKWGVARALGEGNPSEELVFNVWNDNAVIENEPRAYHKDRYRIKMGYWKSGSDQLSLEERDYRDRLPVQSPDLSIPDPLRNNKVCSTFRQRTDQVIGLVIEIETETAEGVETKVLYGLTQDPIYTED